MSFAIQKLDILAFGAHPDDIELSCAGTLMAAIAQGKKVGVVDLTKGELGTRGTPELRLEEATKAAAIIGLNIRINLGFADGFFAHDATHQLGIIQVIRAYQPDIVLANAIDDRHPDHAKGAKLVADACFLSGLRKITTTDINGQAKPAWRPQAVYHYIQDKLMVPHFVVDISAFINQKMAAITAYASQFYNPNPNDPEPATYISDKNFLERVKNRNADFGKPCGFDFAEGFIANRYVGVTDLFALI